MPKKLSQRELEQAAYNLQTVIEGVVEKMKYEKEQIKKQIEKTGRKKFIEDSITAYRAWHNQEYLSHLKYIKKLREIQANKYASTPDYEFRLLLKLPTRLYVYLNRFLEPEFPMDDKESYWFSHQFPEFVVPEKI